MAQSITRTKKIYFLVSIEIVSLVAGSNCHKRVDGPVKLYQAAKYGFREINPSSLPTEGVWATWEDAEVIANNNKIEIMQYKDEISYISSKNKLLEDRLAVEEELNKENKSPYKSWMATWGAPLGIIIGIGAGIFIGKSIAERK